MCTLALPLTPTVRSGMDEKKAFEPEEAYEPPAVVEVGSVSSLTGQDASPDSDGTTTADDS